MLTPERAPKRADPLRRIAWLHGAVVGIGAAAIAAILAWERRSGAETTLLAAFLLAVLAGVAWILLGTFRLARRELVERRHAERALRDSESVFRQLADNVREVFYLCEWPAGELIFVSPAFARVWGRGTGEAFSFRQQWIDAIHERDRERVREAWERRAAAGEFDVEYRIARADGEERWIHDRAIPVPDGKGQIVRIVGVAQDVTERTR